MDDRPAAAGSEQRDNATPLNPNATDGEPGLGDPYYPQAGNSGYDVTKYQIMINWDPATQSISGTTTISALAAQQLNSFYFDLLLNTDQVTVNGAPADSIARASLTSMSSRHNRSRSAARFRS